MLKKFLTSYFLETKRPLASFMKMTTKVTPWCCHSKQRISTL